MKKQMTLLLSLMIMGLSIAQGGGFNYKALITDSGQVLATHPVSIRFTVLESGTTSVFQETQSATTDANGIVAVNIGEGTTVSGNFTSIDWGSNPYFLKVEIDTGGGYQDFGTSEFKAVPYAKYAEKANVAEYVNHSFWHQTSNAINSPDRVSIGRPVSAEANLHIKDVAGGDPLLKMESTDNIYTIWESNRANVDDYLIGIDGGNNRFIFANTTTGDFPLAIKGNRVGVNQLNPTAALDVTGHISMIDGNQAADKVLVSDASGVGSWQMLTNNAAFSGWDKDASDDFSGDYSDLANQPVTFYKSGGVLPTNINDDMYHSGSIAVGTTTVDANTRVNILQSGSAAGDVKAVNAAISNTNNDNHYGLLSNLNGSGSGDHYGTYNSLSGIGIGQHYGTANHLSGGGSASHYGTYNRLMGNGSGTQMGTYTNIMNNGNHIHYGSFNSLSGTGSGAHYGYYAQLYNSGGGKQYGAYFNVSNSGSQMHYGSYVELSGTGSGTHYGYYSKLQGVGAGDQVGIKNLIYNNSDGTHYGDYSLLTGTGSGDKYGTYNKIAVSSGGTHYAVYGEAEKAGSYAGYFKGDVYASQKIQAPTSGSADMKAYVYGVIEASGSQSPSASSYGFTNARESTGTYKITFSDSSLQSTQYLVIVTKSSTANARFVSVVNDNGLFRVYIRNLSGDLVNDGFNFVVYKK